MSTLYCEEYVIRCASKNKYHEDIMYLKKNQTMCSKYDNQYRLNSQHHWVNLYDHLTSKRIFTFMMNKVFVRAPKVMRNIATTFMWICYQTCTHRMFHSLGEVV